MSDVSVHGTGFGLSYGLVVWDLAVISPSFQINLLPLTSALGHKRTLDQCLILADSKALSQFSSSSLFDIFIWKAMFQPNKLIDRIINNASPTILTAIILYSSMSLLAQNCNNP